MLTALQKDPHNRFPSALAFAQALEQASNQLSGPFASGFVPAPSNGPSTNQLPSSPYSQTQTPAQYRTEQHYSDNLTPPISQANGQPLLYPAYPAYPAPQMPPALPQIGEPPPPPLAYPLYPANQIYSPPQTGQPRPLVKERRSSRRAVIAALAGSVVAVAGSGLAYYAYISSRKGSSGLSGLLATAGTHLGNPGISSAIPKAPLMTFNDHTKTVWTVSWSPNGKYIASASDDGTSHVWNVSTQKRLFSYRSRIQPARSDDGAYALAWTPKSTGLAIGFADGTAQLVNLTDQQIGSYDSGTGGDLRGILYAVSISPNGRYLALGGFFSDDIQIFDVVTQRKVRTLSGHTDSVWSLSWSHNGRYIASGSADATARVWDGNTGKLLLIYDKLGDTVRAVSWSPDDARIASGGLSGPVYIWAADSGQTLLTYGNQDDFEVLAVEWSHNGKYIASGGGSDAKTHVWDAQKGQLLQTFPSQSINSVSWSPDDARIVTANDNVVQVWQI